MMNREPLEFTWQKLATRQGFLVCQIAYFGSHYCHVFTGVYLNQYGTPESQSTGQYVPPGWTNWVALVGNRYKTL